MTITTKVVSAGVSLALFMNVTVAQAQVVPSGDPGTTAALNTMRPQRDFQPARDEPVALVTRSNLTGGLRAPRQGDNDVGVISLSNYMAAFPEQGEAGFNAIQAENRHACARSGDWIRRAIQQAAAIEQLRPEWTTIRQDLVKMALDLNRASQARFGFNVIGTGLLCALSLGYYCGAAVSSGIGNEFTGRAHTRQSQLNVRQSDLNARQSEIQLDQATLFTDMSIGWSLMINGYCLVNQVDATLGDVSMSYTPTPVSQ